MTDRPDAAAHPPDAARSARVARAALVRLVRDEGTRVFATLIRVTGDLQLAEDCVQDATVRALETWPRDGVPDVPRAWLTVTARRRAVDVVRRERNRTVKEAAAMDDPQHVPAPDAWGADPSDDLPADLPDALADDDLLRLVFTCCHPALDLDAQVALALRTLCGLSTAEVARALLLPEATAAKRLTRAKQKIARARIPYRVPAAHELPDRVAGVAACVYLLFNEGYAATAGDDPLRADLTEEAVRLGRLLVSLMPDEPALLGLLALMLLHDSCATRTGRGGTRPSCGRASSSSAQGCAGHRTGRTRTSSRLPSPPVTRSRRPTTRPTGPPSSPGTTCC
jgi:RNA polymerase sigma-70 factor (ECF subfamily)